MPHRVADFLRSSTETFSAAAVNTIKSSIRPQQQAPVRRRIERFPSYDPSLSEQYDEIPYLMYAPEPAPVKEKKELAKRERKEKDKMLKSHKKDKTNHRISLPFGRSREIHENPHAALDWKIESPPIIFFGDAESSSGALVSGQMIIEVKDEHLEIENFSAALNIHVHQKKPFMANCADCLDQYTELKKWTFLSHPTTLRKGRHQYPFSILLEGHLPASLDTPLVSIAYEFKSEVTLAKNARISALPIKFWKDFDVKRSLVQPDTPHHSVRVFPPTNIKAGADYDQIIHSTGSQHAVQLRLDGLTTVNDATKTVEYWKLKKITWKLEETIKTVAPACKKHQPTTPAEGSAPVAQKGASRTETRVLGERHMHDGWKSDYTATDGHVEFGFEYGVAASLLASSKNGTPGFACDSRSLDGTSVSHALMIEMVVSKEWAPAGKPHLAAQTGTGRILRMQYHIMLTECAGLGVSWDNEAPPVYSDVPPSPPAYPNAQPIDYEALEMLDALRTSPEPRA
ncbi:hypothetical protein D7B24_005415 [Verticillium nonalfalfae]|uniref:LDB19 N-terminal domain-containing protein n=1 Tax=Verticillium nonalfalfae TaxID=1051616 RepID=A0A3M9YC32_9PEZI|nr:uncharacterized protein D7B24_005415 [Verticillium nonalfalfae]RNJ57934.1 hypothetical protein D7B24_005415 [Verticillium nonalfalfae]